MPLIFPYSAQILLENALLCRQNTRLKNRLLCSKFCRQNLSKPTRSIARFPAKKRWHSLPPVGLSWDSTPPPAESVRTDGRTDGRSRHYYVTTKISRIDRLPNFLTNGAPLNCFFQCCFSFSPSLVTSRNNEYYIIWSTNNLLEACTCKPTRANCLLQ